ncbi:hypothetical protein ACEPPN_009905 [Leptodophora sp. 'Broadleaf-Isolate-01']
MVVRILTFDPDGDLYLRLTYPLEKISPFKTEDGAKADTGGNASDSWTNAVVLLPPGSAYGSTEAVEDTHSDSAEEAPKKVDMLVSSKHLMLASPVFKAMFRRGGFLEGNKLQSGGVVVIPFPDDDPDIFKILLNIVHGRVRQVPEKVGIDDLTGLAILVDKYQMHEVVEFHVRMWMLALRKSLPTKLDSTLLAWISVCYVFRLSAEYRQVTRLAELESYGPLGVEEEQDLPIPAHVLDRIERHRQAIIASLLGTIIGIMGAYNKASVICPSIYNDNLESRNYACDSMIVGSMLKSASSQGLWPLPLAPYPGRSIKQTAEETRKLKLVAMCDAPFNYWGQSSPLPAHGVIKYLHDAASRAEKECEGLAFDGAT